MAISKELQALNDALKNNQITQDQYKKQYMSQASKDVEAKRLQKVETMNNNAIQNAYNTYGTNPVDMWTGGGIAKVNPLYVQKNLKEGWTLEIPTTQETDRLVEIAQQGGQGAWNPTTGVTTVKEPTNVSVPNTMISSTQPSSNYSGQISDQFKTQTDILVNQLKEKIAQSKAEQEAIKTNAPRTFDPLRSQSELAKAQQLRQALERSANLGDRGGIGRSEALQTQTAGENRLNSINLQQQDVIDRANQQIAQLESQGRFEEANIINQQKLAELQALMSEQQRRDEIARQDSLRADELARTTSQEQRQAELDTISRYSTDYQAEINRRQQTTDTSDDWLIPYLQTARQEKISTGNLDPKTGRPLQSGPTQDDWDNAYKKWNSGIPLTQQEMQILGTGSSVKPVTSSGSTPRSTTVTQDRNYAFDLWEQLGTANETVANILNIPVGTQYSGQQQNTSSTVKPYQDYIETYYRKNENGVNTVDKNGVAMYLVQLDQNGQGQAAEYLASVYGIPIETIELAERILGNRR